MTTFTTHKTLDINWQPVQLTGTVIFPLAPPLIPPLTDSCIHLWLIHLTNPSLDLTFLRSLLAESECERTDRYVFARHRRSYLVSQSHLRLILSHYLTTQPDAIEFSQGEHGKPFIEGSAVQFNMSRAGDYALYGIGLDANIGVDIERWHEHFDFNDIIEQNFSRRENTEYVDIPDELKEACFYKGWTCKEAYIKAIGEGLYYDFSLFDVLLHPEDPAKLIAVENNEMAAQKWRLHAVNVEDTHGKMVYNAAVAVDKEITTWRGYKAV